MKQVGESAEIPLSTHCIRLSSKDVLRAGAANWAAEFPLTCR